MKFDLILITASVLLNILYLLPTLHVVQARVHKRSNTNHSISLDGVTTGGKANMTDICIATYVGENTTIITKISSLSPSNLTIAETLTELLNKSLPVTQFIHFCDPECEHVDVIYLNNHSLEESNYFADYYTNYICIEAEPPADLGSLVHTLRVLSLCFMCISLISNAFYLLKFIIDKNLRTLPGCCVLSLSIATLIVYPCFFAIKITPFSENTRFICGLLFYATLANWFWINAITFDLWITIRLSIVKFRRIGTESQTFRFIYYSMYAWGIPSVITFIILHPFSSHPTQIFHTRCSTQEKNLSKIYIVIPFIILQFANFALFYSSFCMVFKDSRATLQPERSEISKIKSNFLFFFKLSCFMGVIWIFGIVGYITKIELLIYMYTYAKILEGPYMVWSFTSGNADNSCMNRFACCFPTPPDTETTSL